MLVIAAIAYSAAAILLLLTIFVFFPYDLLRRDLESSILEEYELPNSNR
jgi:hypothetical protein